MADRAADALGVDNVGDMSLTAKFARPPGFWERLLKLRGNNRAYMRLKICTVTDNDVTAEKQEVLAIQRGEFGDVTPGEPTCDIGALRSRS